MSKDELFRDLELSNVEKPEYAQPLCTALQIALVELLESCAVVPSAVIGHSSGEIAAAYSVGGVSRECAWKIAYFRGLFAARLNTRSHRWPGSMMSIALSETECVPFLAMVGSQGKITVGCVNSPSNVTVSGDESSISALETILDRNQVFTRRLSTGVAYHSVQIEEITPAYLDAIQDLTNHSASKNLPHAPIMISTVTGKEILVDDLRQSKY